MIYKISIEAEIASNLSRKNLEDQLVVALYNVDNQYSKLDGVDESLEVLDYIKTDAMQIRI